MRVPLQLLLLSSITSAVVLPDANAQDYYPPDEQQWHDMKNFFWSLSAPGATHEAIQRYMQQVENESRMKQARKQAPTPPPKDK